MSTEDTVIYEVYVAELKTPVLIMPVGADAEFLKNLPFDGQEHSDDLTDIEDRVSWVLRTCVSNLDKVQKELESRDDIDPNSALLTIYQSCIALNPALDMSTWTNMTRQRGIYHDILDTPSLNDTMTRVDNILMLPDVDQIFGLPDLASTAKPPWSKEDDKPKDPNPEVSKKKVLALQDYLDANLIGQGEAVAEVVKTLKRSVAGLKDPSRPLGVFLCAGPSGSGKTLLAKLVHKHLFGSDSRLVRIDCTEYQQKHEVSKLLGAPNGYVSYEEGGQLTNAIKEAQNTVLLLDEAEKAHEDFWNIFLPVFDEGYMTSNSGEKVSFENTIIIMTSNIGNNAVVSKAFSKGVGFNSSLEGTHDSGGIPPRDLVVRETKEAIRKYFKPEFLNRIDSTVIFNYLTEDDLCRIARLELYELRKKLKTKDIVVRWNKNVEKALAVNSKVATQGARAMARTRRAEIEDVLTDQILKDELVAQDVIRISAKKDGDRYSFSFSKLPAVT